jgi:hypothetical protein
MEGPQPAASAKNGVVVGSVSASFSPSGAISSARPHLDIYKQYIKGQWSQYYFAYDKLIGSLKEVDRGKDETYVPFDKSFLTQIRKVDLFIIRLIESIELELAGILKFWENASAEEKEKTIQNKSSRLNQNFERIIKALILKTNEAIAFYDFNNFSIRKLAFNLEVFRWDGQSLENFESKHFRTEISNDKSQWTFFDSNLIVMSAHYFKNTWISRREKLVILEKECKILFTKIFRQKYTFLTDLELRFQKNSSNSYKALVSIGIKLGAIFAMILTIFVLSFVFHSYDMFRNPALYILSAVGSVLAFKLFWSCNVAIWHYYGINYVTLLDFDNLQADHIATISDSLSALVVYFIIVILYTLSLGYESYFYQSFLVYLCPPLLIVLTFGYRTLQAWVFDIKSRSSDVITFNVLGRYFLHHLYQSPSEKTMPETA